MIFTTKITTISTNPIENLISYSSEPKLASWIPVKIVEVNVLVVENKLNVGPLPRPPATIVTAVASPKARPTPKIIPANIPGLAAFKLIQTLFEFHLHQALKSHVPYLLEQT